MLLILPTLQGMLSAAAASAQEACTALLDLSIGSPARAILQATSALWGVAQNDTYLLLQATRLQTCFGADVDSFVGDYSLTRDPAVASTGVVTLTRFAPIGSATVLVGDTVRTGDGSLTFALTADTTNACWTATVGTSGGYVIPAGTASIGVPVQCTTAGVVGNVIAGAISLAGTAWAGVDVVSNAAPFVNGQDGESDAALKLRFIGYIGSLTKSTPLAVLTAAMGVQAGLSCVIAENVNEAGLPQPGHFVVYVDDGSGHPPSTLLTSIYGAVDAVRPICSTFSIQPPAVIGAIISFTITVSSGVAANLYAAIQTAVATYVNALPTGGILSITKLGAVVFAVNPTITNITGITVNGGTSDIQAAANAVVKLTSCTVSSS